MASGMGLMGCLIIVAALLKSATADTHVVGGDLQWKIPPVASSLAYSSWAARQSFEVGDTLVFNWTGTHDVAEVSKTDYDNCNKSNPIGTILTTSPANVTINSNTSHYYICTIESHCELGQKVTISIGSSASSASSLTVGALSAVLLIMAISFSSYM